MKGQDANAKQVCFTGKDGRIESGQPVVAAVIIEPEGEPKKLLRVTLPVLLLRRLGIASPRVPVACHAVATIATSSVPRSFVLA